MPATKAYGRRKRQLEAEERQRAYDALTPEEKEAKYWQWKDEHPR